MNVAQTGKDLQQQGTEEAKGIKPRRSRRKRLRSNNTTAVSHDIPMTVFYTGLNRNLKGTRGKATFGDVVFKPDVIIEGDVCGLDWRPRCVKLT